jgi:hypothetical protein
MLPKTRGEAAELIGKTRTPFNLRKLKPRKKLLGEAWKPSRKA